MCRYGSGTEDHPAQDNNPLPVRPEFPPPSLHLVPAFAAGLDAKLGADMLMIWTFLHSFGDLLGLPAATLDDLLAAGEISDTHHAVLSVADPDTSLQNYLGNGLRSCFVHNMLHAP